MNDRDFDRRLILAIALAVFFGGVTARATERILSFILGRLGL